jgi:ABC-2 type transport system permease protein
MLLSNIFILTQYYYFIFKKNFTRFILIIIWPTFDLIIWGFTTIYISQNNIKLSNFNIFIISSFILWNFLVKAQQELPSQIMDDVFSKSFNSILISPIKLWELIIALMVSSIIKIFLLFIFFLIINFFLFSINILNFDMRFIFFFINLIVFGWVLGIIVTGFIFRFGYRVQFLTHFFALFIQPFSCVFYPRDILPRILKELSFFSPPSYIFESMRSIILGTYKIQESYFNSFSTIILLNSIYILFGLFFFVFMFKWSKRTGNLTKI